MPLDKKVKNSSIACYYKLLKDEKHRVRITSDGDRLLHAQDAGYPSEYLLETKTSISQHLMPEKGLDLCVLM